MATTPTTPEGIIPKLLLERMQTLPFSPALGIAYPGRSFADTGSTYLEIQWFPNKTFNAFLADTDPDWFRGILQITVVAPATDEGIIGAADTAGIIAADLKAATITGSGITIKIDDRPSIASIIQEDHAIRIPVSAGYRCFA